MMAISSRAYSYLLDQASVYQASLGDQISLGAAEITSVVDGDDVSTVLVVQQYVQC